MAVAEIVSEEEVEDGALADFVAPDAGSVEGFQQLLSDVLVTSLLFVNSGEIVIQESTVIIEVPSVGRFDPAKQFQDMRKALFQVAVLPKHFDR